MFFYLHYVLMTSGLSGTSVLLAVYFKAYTGASQAEIGALLMSMPFVSLFIKPLFCSIADRHQAHRLCLILALLVEIAGFAPFALVPLFPNFYTNFPRASWYLLAGACHLGCAGLGVAWSLGDCLAVNYAQRANTHFSRMRLMGTLSWGLYGFIIGQINEVPALPKYIPAFLILHASLLIELLLVIFWNKQDFIMVDPLTLKQQAKPNASNKLAASGVGFGTENEDTTQTTREYNEQLTRELEAIRLRKSRPQIEGFVDSLPSSLGGTLKINPKAAKVLMDVFAANDGELQRQLAIVEEQQHSESCDNFGKCLANGKGAAPMMSLFTKTAVSCEAIPNATSPTRMADPEAGIEQVTVADKTVTRNPQLLLLKMILLEDGRVIKYLLLFTMFGVMMAPNNFLFVSIEELSHERGYNFSQLAGAILISQALIETLSFFATPYLLRYLTRCTMLSLGLVIMSAKYFFYAGWLYEPYISPYWVVLAEWSHGISYGIFATIQADVALMFANQSRLFIPELRRLGFLSDNVQPLVMADNKEANAAKAHEAEEAEERSIKMALRATMQALLNAFMEGMGIGAGSLLCGLVIEIYSYITLWESLAALASLTIVLHLLVETTRSRWSDSFRPQKGTKAYEIMELSRSADENERRRSSSDRDRHQQAAGSVDGSKATVVSVAQHGER